MNFGSKKFGTLPTSAIESSSDDVASNNRLRLGRQMMVAGLGYFAIISILLPWLVSSPISFVVHRLLTLGRFAAYAGIGFGTILSFEQTKLTSSRCWLAFGTAGLLLGVVYPLNIQLGVTMVALSGLMFHLLNEDHGQGSGFWSRRGYAFPGMIFLVGILLTGSIAVLDHSPRISPQARWALVIPFLLTIAMFVGRLPAYRRVN